MSRIIFLLFFALLFQAHQSQATAFWFDSVGVETQQGKLFVVHKVEPKETLYALARKYKVTVNQIIESNNNIEAGIAIGQLVYIPRKNKVPGATAAGAPVGNASAKPVVPAAQASRTYNIDEQGQKIHVVEPKQTLYSLSRMYGTTVEDIKKWNDLPSNEISIGANLIVGHNGKITKAAVYIPEEDDAVPNAKVSAAADAVVMAPALRTEPAESTLKEEAKAEPALVEKKEDAEDMPSFRTADNVGKVIETGLAEVIDQKGDVNKYLALHKTAPVGTILQVKNIMNGQTVYVRVIGPLPPTGTNEKVIVKVSKKAYQKLAALDNRFRVELSYMP
jgi:LysM repeat protein